MNRWGFKCRCLRFPCARVRGSVSGEEGSKFFRTLPLLLVLQSLHLSVGQPKLMDLSADRQTARCQLCSAWPDYETQLISSPSTPKIDAGQLDCVLASVCVCVFWPCMVICPFSVYVTICPLFPLLTTKINKLSYKRKQDRVLTWRNVPRTLIPETPFPQIMGIENIARKKVEFEVVRKYSSLLCGEEWQDIRAG